MCRYTVYNEETGTRLVIPAEPWWDAGYLTITVRDVGSNDMIGARIESGGQVWESGLFHARTHWVEMTLLARA